MIITPILLPQMPNPSAAECSTLLSYTNSVIVALETVHSRLYEVSSNPDEAMLLIREKVETMLSESKTMRSSLNSIEAEAVKKANFYSQSQTMA